MSNLDYRAMILVLQMILPRSMESKNAQKDDHIWRKLLQTELCLKLCYTRNVAITELYVRATPPTKLKHSRSRTFVRIEHVQARLMVEQFRILILRI